MRKPLCLSFHRNCYFFFHVKSSCRINYDKIPFVDVILFVGGGQPLFLLVHEKFNFNGRSMSKVWPTRVLDLLRPVIVEHHM